MKRIVIGLLLFSLLQAGSAVAANSKKIKSSKKLTLNFVAQKALTLSPELRKSMLSIKSAKLTLQSVKYRRLNSLNLDVKGGLLPGLSSNAEYDRWGGFFQVGLTFSIPLYTFGKISKGIEAATYGIMVAEARKEIDIQNILLRGLNAYWMLSTALRIESMAFDLRKDYRKLLKEVRIESKKEKSDTTAVDLLKVKSNLYNISKVVQGSVANRKTVEQSMLILLKGSGITSLTTSDEEIPVLGVSSSNLSHFLLYARAKRKEYKAIRYGLMALDAQIAVKKRERAPDLYLAGGVQYKWASNRPDTDDLNSGTGAGAFLGIVWRLDFWRRNNALEQQKIRRKKLLQDKKLLDAKVAMDVSKALNEVQRNYILLDKVNKSFKSAKTWFRIAGDNWEMGLGPVGEVIGSRNTYYTIKGAKIRQEHELHLSLIKLAYVMGDISLYLRWVKDGKVTL